MGIEVGLNQMNILFVAGLSAGFFAWRQTVKKKEALFDKEDIPSFAEVPFFYIPSFSSSQVSDSDSDTNRPNKDLYVVLEKFKNDCDTIISSLIASYEIAIKSEWSVISDNDDNADDNFSNMIEQRIKNTAAVLEYDYFLLEKLLKPAHLTLALPSSAGAEQWTPVLNDSHEGSSSYDSGMQIITHIVRDWSDQGTLSRDSLYQWCISELMNGMRNEPVLVPGAGLGRLARDISLAGFNVQANELSLVMSTVAYHFLNGNVDKSYVHPFAFDFLINEVTASDRYQKIEFSNSIDDEFVSSLGGIQKGSLSYTIGDFVEVYSQREQRGTYGSIVTCFFIDTASNIYEYLLVIRNALKGGGRWINVGPLQWHSNAKLHPSGDELQNIIKSMGFRIESWKVDDKAINYRHDDTNEDTRHTKFEGYRPLRFVATLPPRIRHGLGSENAAEKIMQMRNDLSTKKGQQTKRKDPNPKYEATSHVTITEIN